MEKKIRHGILTRVVVFRLKNLQAADRPVNGVVRILSKVNASEA